VTGRLHARSGNGGSTRHVARGPRHTCLWRTGRAERVATGGGKHQNKLLQVQWAAVPMWTESESLPKTGQVRCFYLAQAHSGLKVNGSMNNWL